MKLMTDFRDAMAQLGSAITIITTDGAAGKFGFTASAVCSVTDQPPTLLICMNRSSFANSKFKENGVLCVNVLSASHRELSGVFANGSLRSEERFAYDIWQTNFTGSPVLTSAITSFDCEIGECHEVGSHSIFYCPVKEIIFGKGEEGLVYFNRNYHTLGMQQ